MKGWEKSTVESTGDYLWKIIWLFLSVEYISLGMENEVWEIADTSQDIIQTHGEWELLGINKATPKKSVGTNLYDQIIFYVSSEAFAFSFLFFFFSFLLACRAAYNLHQMDISQVSGFLSLSTSARDQNTLFLLPSHTLLSKAHGSHLTLPCQVLHQIMKLSAQLQISE